MYRIKKNVPLLLMVLLFWNSSNAQKNPAVKPVNKNATNAVSKQVVKEGQEGTTPTAEDTKKWIIDKLQNNLSANWRYGACDIPAPAFSVTVEIIDENLIVTYQKVWDGSSKNHNCPVWVNNRQSQTITDKYSVRMNLQEIDTLSILQAKLRSSDKKNYIKGSTVSTFDAEYKVTSLTTGEYVPVPNYEIKYEGYNDVTGLTITESNEPNLSSRLLKAIRHYLKVMPSKRQTELF